MAVNLVILPIFEADFRPCQYGFRSKIDAKMARRVSDGRLLSLLKHLLETPVLEAVDGKVKVTNTSKRTHRHTLKGGVISRLLANIYFRRFVLAWETFGFQAKFNAQIVNYADDFVICYRNGGSLL